MHTILIVDDEIKLLEVLSIALENMGYNILTATSAEGALEMLEEESVHLVLSDLRLPGLSGRELLEKVKSTRPDLPVVIMTAYSALKDAVEIIKEGAFDYMVKPFDLDVLKATVTSALRFYALSSENKNLKAELEETYAGIKFIGESKAFLNLKKSIEEVCDSSANVLITGESGTGKELVAKAIHHSSPRSSGPLVTVNCAAIPETLLESELFGHAKGAFTGATVSRPGRFVQADGGTIFLDEIGDMAFALQSKILRCIQEKVVEAVGSHVTQKVDVRIIAATNKDLAAAIVEGTFRQDLYYRLNVYPIAMPALRDRAEDIPLLSEYFASHLAKEMGKKPIAFAAEAMQEMQSYSWPGNVRELENCIERLTIIAPGTLITPQRLAASSIFSEGVAVEASQGVGVGASLVKEDIVLFPTNLDTRLEDIEREIIMKALGETNGVQARAAEMLGISERSMWHRIKKLGITIQNKISS